MILTIPVALQWLAIGLACLTSLLTFLIRIGYLREETTLPFVTPAVFVQSVVLFSAVAWPD